MSCRTTSSESARTDTPLIPIIDPIPSITRRLSLGFRTWAFKVFGTIALRLLQIVFSSMFRKYAPTYTKKYPVRHSLTCRVFIPKTHNPGTSLPLYIDIHGGGFIGGSPAVDDKICHYICNKFDYVVVSVQYRLAPRYPFPIGADDCTAIILDIISDPGLPVDHKKIAIGGQSAGSNLALAVVQDPRVRSQIKALVAFYPTVDFSRRYAGDYRDKPAGPDGKGAEADGLRSIVPMVSWAYPKYDQDRTDPRLSPIFAPRATLPDRIYFIGSQYDKLCEEAFLMAKQLAHNEKAKEEEDWDVNGIRWERVPGEVHGFLEQGWRSEIFGGEDLPWKNHVEAVLGRVNVWLEDCFPSS